jgi:glycosyltransferase involved in cell wall biosynthesis
MSSSIDISVVVPMMNEEENAKLLYDELHAVLPGMNRPYEIIFVNDGSTDKTQSILGNIAKNDHHVTLMNFRRNFGQTAAMSAGFKRAQGTFIVAMDGDLQNDPKDIPMIIAKMEEGYDLVSGWRKNRKDKSISRKLPSKIANWLIRKITKVHFNDYGCSLKGYRKDMLDHVDLYGEMHRFIPVHASRVGAKMSEVPVNHRAREFGQTKYGISRTFRVILDLITAKFLQQFSSRPLHFIGMPALFFMFLGFAITFYLSALKIFTGADIGSRPMLLLGVLLIVVGVQILSIGLIGEMTMRNYYAHENKKPYILKSIISSGEETIS